MNSNAPTDSEPLALKSNEGLGPPPTSAEDEAVVLARLSKTPAEAYERGYLDGAARERERCITAVFAWAHDAIDRKARATFSAPTAAEQIVRRL